MSKEPKSLGQLMRELGFRPNGSEATKRAFIKNLSSAAGLDRASAPLEREVIDEPQQLSLFDHTKAKRTS